MGCRIRGRERDERGEVWVKQTYTKTPQRPIYRVFKPPGFIHGLTFCVHSISQKCIKYGFYEVFTKKNSMLHLL